MIKAVLKDIVNKPMSGEWGIEGDAIRVIRTTNFTNEGRLNLSDVVTRNIEPKKVQQKQLLKGDIIIEKSGGSPTQPVGRVVYFEEDDTYLCNNFTSVLRPKVDTVFPKYLLYQLFCNHRFGFTAAFQNKTTGIINLQLTKYIEKLQIPLPPLPVQQKIAAILDEADKLRQLNKQLIAKYDELTQSLFLDMFGDPVTNPKGWEKVDFNQFASFDTRMTKDFEYYAELPHVGIANIEKESGRLINMSKVKDENLASGKYKFDSSHIIYSKIRPNLNKVALPTFEGLCSADSYPLKVNLEVSNRVYFAHLLRSDDFVEFILGHSTRTNIPKANKAQMLKYKGMCPPIDLQNQFAERVQAIEAQKSQAQQGLEKAEDLFNSLLQRAFKGELSV